jgi:hypothetical protein
MSEETTPAEETKVETTEEPKAEEAKGEEPAEEEDKVKEEESTATFEPVVSIVVLLCWAAEAWLRFMRLDFLSSMMATRGH